MASVLRAINPIYSDCDDNPGYDNVEREGAPPTYLAKINAAFLEFISVIRFTKDN